MSPDQAAELLQIPERGGDLLKRYTEEDNVAKAIQAVQAGFAPHDVCSMYGLPYDPEEAAALEAESDAENPIKVFECKTARCRNKNKVATASAPEGEEVEPPECPTCHQPMTYIMAVEDPDEISHMPRVKVKAPRMADPLSRTDKHREGSPWEDADEDD